MEHKTSIISDLKADLLKCSDGEKGISIKCFVHPSFMVSFGYRLAHLFHNKNLNLLAQIFTAINRFITGCDIHYSAKISGGVLFPHGHGVVIGKNVVIEKNCSIFHNTTFGEIEGKDGAPVLDEGVNVYSGSVLAGNVHVGEYSRIGPNVYLTESVDSHTRVLPEKPQINRKKP